MSPHDSAVKKAVEPNELYDSLNQTGQDVWDLIGSKGFRPDQNAEKQWIALDTNGDDIVGPCESLSALASAVDQHIGNAASPSIDDAETNFDEEEKPKKHKLQKLPQGSTDAPFLAGMAPTVNKQLANAIIAQHKAKMARVEATAEETKQNKNMAVVGTLHKGLYQADPSQPGSKVFRVGKITSRLIHTEEEKFVTEKASSGMAED